MAEYTVDLSPVVNAVNRISTQIDRVDSNVINVRQNVSEVDENVKIVYSELGQLARDFKEYVVKAEMQHQLELATTKIGNIQQQVEVQFGHYGEVRRSATGILQATDVGIVRKETITTVSEEMMIKCQGYWLAPCLVALAAWISDQRDIAEKAVKEAIRRDDDKTSLLFGLICRRADRQEAAIKWISRYLSKQNPESLHREAVVVLDAYSAGLFYSKTDDTINKQLADWLETLIAEPGFLETETARWKSVMESRRRPLGADEYPYLRQYSKTWDKLESIMEGANLHQTIMEYFEKILATTTSRGAVKAQLDEIMNTLVTSYDDEELPLRQELRECELIIEFEGDVNRAQQMAQTEKAVFDERSSFTELLTKAVMFPEDVKASPATQKLALALSKDWIADAYGQIIAENRMNIPAEIEINIDTFNDKTKDGSDEDRLVKAFNDLIDVEKREALEETKLKPSVLYAGIGGAVLVVIGLIMALLSFTPIGNLLLGLAIMVIGGFMIFRYFGKQRSAKTQREQIDKQFEEKRTKGVAILRALIAEIVDFNLEFEIADAVGEDVVDLLEQLNPEEYINNSNSSSVRTVNLNA